MLTDPKLRSQVDALWDKFWNHRPEGFLERPAGFVEEWSLVGVACGTVRPSGRFSR